jgi:hypothetical protein
MAGPYSHLLPDGRGWLWAIGQRLRAEYDALAEPMPPHLVALLDRLAAQAEGEVQQYDGSAFPPENSALPLENRDSPNRP